MIATGNEVLQTSDRDRVLQAMAECCAERGYRETTVAAVLERAGVGEEEFAGLFASKEDCALAAINKLISDAISRVSIAERSDGEPSLRRAIEACDLVELLTAAPSFAQLTLVEARQGGTKRLAEAYGSALRVLALLAERAGGGDSGLQGPATRALLGGAEALVRRELVAGRHTALPQQLGSLVYGALVAVVGQREALSQAKLARSLVREESR
jgi:AcrR family transcriptional regulator